MTGWIEWDGGACPVPAETLLEIRCTDGETGFVTAEMCSMQPDWWSDRHGPRFITAYRVLELDMPDDTGGKQAEPASAAMSANDSILQQPSASPGSA